MTNREKTEWLGRYRKEAARQAMLCREVEDLRAEAERVARLLGDPQAPGLCRVRAQLREACRQLDAQAARCLTLRRQLVWAVSRLDDERQREVLLRRFLHGQSVREIADEMGVVVRRVEQMQTAALRALELRGAARGARQTPDPAAGR